MSLLTSEGPTSILGRLSDFFSARQTEAYLVGGFVRDSLLSLPSHDLDIALPGDPFHLGRELALHLNATFIPLSQSPRVARLVVTDQDRNMVTVDLTGFHEGIAADLARRDFTVNALALPLAQWAEDDWQDSVLDLYEGKADLRRKHIRALGPDVFREDPGRLLRSVRLAAGLKFRLEPATARLVRAEAYRVSRVSGERLRDEFLAILASDGAMGQLEILDRLDLLCRVIPELEWTKGVDQPKSHHYWDVWGHSLHAVGYAELVTKGHQNSAIYSLVPWTEESDRYFSQEVSDGHTRRTILKLAALFHDIAKPQTKAQDETGHTHFLGHPDLGAEMARERLTQLRLSARGIHMVARMVEEHLRPPQTRQKGAWPTHRAIYRYFRDLGDVAVDTIYLAMADYLAAQGPQIVPDRWGNYARMLTHILQSGTQPQRIERVERLITGHDLMQHLGLSPGPQIGELLEVINEAKAAGEITTREEALDLAAASLNRNHD